MCLIALLVAIVALTLTVFTLLWVEGLTKRHDELEYLITGWTD